MSDRRTILVVSSEGPGYLYGGIGRHTVELTRCLGEQHDVHALCVPTYCLDRVPRGHTVREEATPGHQLTVLDAEQVQTLRTTPFDAGRYQHVAARLAARVAAHLPRAVDCVLLEDHYEVGLAMALTEHVRVRRSVYFSHLPLSARFSYFDKGVDEERQQVLEAGAVLCADRVMTPSESARRALCSVYAIAPDRVSVTPLGAAAPSSAARGVARDPSRVITVARFSQQKGWLAYLRTVACVESQGCRPNWHLVGDGPLRGVVLARLAAIVPSSRLCWSPHLDAADALPEALAASAVFFLPSAHETFGLAALEAARAGAVPVLGDVGAVPEVWGTDAILVPPGDVRAAVAAIVGLLTDPERCDGAARRARARAERFDWAAHANTVAEVCFGA